MPRPSEAAAGILLLLLYAMLPVVLAISEPAPAPVPRASLEERGFGNLMHGMLGLNSSDIDGLIDDSLAGIGALLKALNDGTVVQNGLMDMLKINMATLKIEAAANGTGNATTSPSSPSNCPDLAVLFARGTTEPGNMGLLTGPPLTTALQHYSNTTRVAIQGIDYRADVDSFLAGGSASGAATMAALVNVTASMCPKTQLSLSGYSQGAQVVRKALTDMVPVARISSVVLFGDPLNGTAVPLVDAGRVRVFCHDGDDICKGGDVVLPAHLSYSNNVAAGAMFMMQHSGLGMASQDAMQQGMGDIPTMNNRGGAGK